MPNKNAAPVSCAKILKGRLWWSRGTSIDDAIFVDIPNGALAVDEHGTIIGSDTAKNILKHFKAKRVIDHGEAVLLPGFVDLHIHFPQLNIIACHGESLLKWLDRYVFPEEMRFNKPAFAKPAAKRFCEKLLHNGTTSAVVFSSSSEKATDLLFQAAAESGMRAVIGKTSMDKHAPAELRIDPADDLRATKALIKKWHGYEDRLYYALTPRFAPSCSPESLTQLGDMAKAYQGLYLQTHFSETLEEVAWVKKLFPKHRHYLDVYRSFGLLGPRTILAHSLHPNATELEMLRDTGSKIAHCPTSNTFLGSGFFPMRAHADLGIAFGMGTDVGAGTSFSIWHTLAEAYKVQRLQKQELTPAQMLYLGTLAGAKVLGQEKTFGHFEVGAKADIQVIDWQEDDDTSERISRSISDGPAQFFAMCFLFKTEHLKTVYLAGRNRL